MLPTAPQPRVTRIFHSLLAGTLLLFLAAPSPTSAQPDTTQGVGPIPPPTGVDTTEKDAPYVPTSQRIVRRMLEVAGVAATDVVYDLGSGDGRIPITAATEFGARGVGIEIDPDLVAKSRKKAREAGVADRVDFRQKDLFDVNLEEATVVALYLWPEINAKLLPKLLRELDPGDRIVSHDFRMGAWEPDRTIEAGPDKTGTATLYLWVVPEEIPPRLMKKATGEVGERP